MATQTTNIGLTKPSNSDPVDISVLNSNSDIIDSKIQELINKTGGTSKQLVSSVIASAVGSATEPVYIDSEGNATKCSATLNNVNSTNTNDKIYIVGTKTQTSNAATYSNSKAYIENGKISLDEITADKLNAGDYMTDANWGIYSGTGISLGGLNGSILELDKYSFAYLTDDVDITADTSTSFTIECPNKASVDKCLITFWGTKTAKANDNVTDRVIIDSFTFVMEITSNDPTTRTVGYVNNATGCSSVSRSYDATTGDITVTIGAISGSRTGKLRYKAIWLPINGWTKTRY